MREEYIYKRNYSANLIEILKQKLGKVNRKEVKRSKNANESYGKFSEICTSLYEEYFLKQKLYEKLLKKPNAFNETAYKAYKDN